MQGERAVREALRSARFPARRPGWSSAEAAAGLHALPPGSRRARRPAARRPSSRLGSPRPRPAAALGPGRARLHTSPLPLQAVAAAALAVSALSNAPPGFLEFLLCIPWRKLPQLYPRRCAAAAVVPLALPPQQQLHCHWRCWRFLAASRPSAAPGAAGQPAAPAHGPLPASRSRRRAARPFPPPQPPARSDSVDQLLSHLDVSDDERRRLVNARIEPALVPVLLDFVYREDHAPSVPPMLQLVGAAGGGVPVRAQRVQAHAPGARLCWGQGWRGGRG